mgnify:CR=1 FL=1|jgi:hypothetical protein
MRTGIVLLLLAIGLFATAHSPIQAAMSEAEKRELFLRAREDIRPVPRKRPRATPRPRTASTPRATPRPKSTPRPEVTPDVIELESDRKKPVRPTKKPAPTLVKKKASSKKSKPAINAPIRIEKSGLVESEGEVSAPKSSGGWFRRWRYLTPSIRRAIDKVRVRKGRWKYTIIHNSGTRQGNARAFDNYHRRVRKMQNGLAYHFVIGNGTSSGDGEIEIGPRWTKQLNGGHVASDYLNDIALGICLVGDLNRDAVTKNQQAALKELTEYLRSRVGKIKGKRSIVLPHKKINPKPTDCPGDRFPYRWLAKEFPS